MVLTSSERVQLSVTAHRMILKMEAQAVIIRYLEANEGPGMCRPVERLVNVFYNW